MTTDLYKENIAKLRLYNRVLKENFIEESQIVTALSEFYKLLGFFAYSTRSEYCMSDIHNKIWKLAAIDTYYYPDICNYACRLIGRREQIIHYEPDIEHGIGRIEDRKLFTYLQYINLFLRIPNRLFWQEINVTLVRPQNINSTNSTPSQQVNQDLYLTSDDETSENFNVKVINVHTSIDYMLTINKTKKVGHLYRKIANLFEKNSKDIKLLMNGTILNITSNVIDIMKDTTNVIHVVIKNHN